MFRTTTERWLQEVEKKEQQQLQQWTHMQAEVPEMETESCAASATSVSRLVDSTPTGNGVRSIGATTIKWIYDL